MFIRKETKQSNYDECGIPLKEYKIVAIRVKKLEHRVCFEGILLYPLHDTIFPLS